MVEVLLLPLSKNIQRIYQAPTVCQVLDPMDAWDPQMQSRGQEMKETRQTRQKPWGGSRVTTVLGALQTSESPPGFTSCGGGGRVGLAAFKQVFPPESPGKQTPCHQKERTQELGRRPGCRTRKKSSSAKFFLEVKIQEKEVSDSFSKMQLSPPGSNERQSNLSKICLNLYTSSQKWEYFALDFSFLCNPGLQVGFQQTLSKINYHCQEIVPLKNCF